MSGQSYTTELRSIDMEIKALNAKLREFRNRKKYLYEKLYEYMKRYNLSEVEGYTIDEVRPKEKKSRLSEKTKRSNAVELFRQVGINHPEKFYDEFKSTQK